MSNELKDSAWLAKRLGVSLTTIERLRVRGGEQLPPHVLIGHSIKYDESAVEAWLQAKQQQQLNFNAEGN